MVILPYVKIGTMPFGCARVKSKRTMPKEGDIVEIKEADYSCVYFGKQKRKNKYDNPWIKVKIDKINDNCFFVIRI